MIVGSLAALLAAGGLIGYVLKRFLADPYLEYRQVRKNIARDLVDYANVAANPGGFVIE